MDLAPISISTYNRLEHLKKTVEALKKNKLADESILYIFSDAPKPGDEEVVKRVREYCDSIDGFKEVIVIKQKSNNMQKNMRDAREIPLKKHGRMIRMEDDIVTASGFLKFINEALEFFKEDQRIFSIAGFTPVNHKVRDLDIYFSPRFAGWGYGIWENRYNMIRSLPSYQSIKRDSETFNRLKNMGDDMIAMIKLESEKSFAGDIRCSYLCAKENLLNIFPTQTLVKNIGLDGSGVHCGLSDIYKHNSLNKKIKFEFNIEYDYKQNSHFIRLNNKKYKKRFLVMRAINKIIRILIKKNIFR
ncbi:hypothetical protein IB683_05480 [Francisella philomiragia]|uniref:hypothetical protein n=1 Tax=Francisella philomiragia TaxID=28110 RepID=UPI0019070E78|nr:hypothetical protein [Francisella philomiragia]MBK2093361.1 hypothetical protein [Francisella philomiragia]